MIACCPQPHKTTAYTQTVVKTSTRYTQMMVKTSRLNSHHGIAQAWNNTQRNLQAPINPNEVPSTCSMVRLIMPTQRINLQVHPNLKDPTPNFVSVARIS